MQTQPQPAPPKRPPRQRVPTPASPPCDIRESAPGRVWFVKSGSRPGREYRVERTWEDEIICSCPASVDFCRHARGVIDLITGAAVPVSRETAIRNRQPVPVITPIDIGPFASLQWKGDPIELDGTPEDGWDEREPEDIDPFLDHPFVPRPTMFTDPIPAGDSTDFIRRLVACGMVPAPSSGVIWGDRTRPLPPKPGQTWGGLS